MSKWETPKANTMGKKKRVPSEPTNLREQAEQVLSTQPGKRSSNSLREMRKLLQDLYVYQIELEMQNEELRRTRLELQAARDRYAELYDFSPAGHLTLDRKGVIQEANLRVSIMLGIPRGELTRQPLIRFIAPSEQSTFARHCLDVFRTGAKQSCNLRFLRSGDATLVIHLESQVFPNETGLFTRCRTALFDITELRQMEAERDRLARSRRLLVDSTGEGICCIDLEGRFTFLNKAGEEMFGYKPDELLGKPMHELVHHHRPDGSPYPREDCHVYSAFRTGQSQRIEDEVFWRREGTAFPVAYSSSPLIEGGVITGAVVVFSDVSERIRTQKQFQALLESAPDAHVFVDQTGKIVLINSQTEKLFGYTRHELLGQSIETLVPERFRGKHAGHRAGFMANPQARAMGAGIELYARRKDGSEFPTEISLNALESDKGLLVAAAIRDITVRKQAEKALWESEQRFHELIDLLPIAVYVCNASGLITQFNRHCVTIWGREPRCGDPHECFNGAHKIFLPDGTPLSLEDTPIAEVLRSSLPQRNKELVIERPDGSRITVLVNPIPLWNQTGEIIGAVNCMLDITDRMRAEQQLQDTLDRVRTLSQRLDTVREEERSQFARELHDELGVRLTCLKLDLARLQILLGESLFPRQKIHEKIVSMTEHVDRTIAEVQRLVVELRPGVLDDLGLVAAIEWQCQDFELRSGIRCVCEATQEEIELDRSSATAAFRISQEALTNVMRHAKATSVRVLLTRANSSLLLEVQDNGQGIPPEKLTDSASLGLLGMRERASNLGGRLEIVGCPGKGTTVTLRLPCSVAPSLGPPPHWGGMAGSEPTTDGFAS